MSSSSSPESMTDPGPPAAGHGRGARGTRRALAALAMLLAGALLGACGGSSAKSTSHGSSTSSSSSTKSSSTSTGVTGSSTAPGVVTATAGGVSATMHASSHSPKVNVPWPVSFVVTRAGAPVRAKVEYEYLFGGNVVAKRSNYSFDGRFDDQFIWPGSAVGYPLTFRAVISAGAQTLFLDYPVQVVR